MVILQVRDNTHDALGANDARVRILTGTATGGATLDNRTGAPALPVNSIRLADVLVPAADTTISNAQIRDRRQWAKGAYFFVRRNANAAAGNDYTTASTSAVEIDTTNLKPRIECSGRPLRVTLHASFTGSATLTLNHYLFVDGADTSGTNDTTTQTLGVGSNELTAVTIEITPTTGSHLIAPAWQVSANTATMLARATMAARFTIEELPSVSASNS
jgi:hypothetical protein